MSELARPLPAAQPREGPLSRALALPLRLSWEAVAYASLFLAGFGFRFWDLGSRALHHDESLHGYYAYQLFLGHGYQHDPLMHGPFQFFGTALTFFVAGGASDYTVRVFPALFGAALVALPLLFRSHLGRLGALAAAGLIAFSPTLLYFSRFARNDIYVAVFTLGLVICLWRYVEERKHRYLYVAAALLALSFATKENTFITAALLLVFLNLWLAADLARQTRDHLGLSTPVAGLAYALVYLPWAWAIAALWPLSGRLRQRLGLRERHPAADFLIVLGTLSAPQLAAAVQLPLDSLLGIQLDTLGEERRWAVPTVSLLLVATAAVGLAWNWRTWLVVAACFYIPYSLLYTSFLTYPGGFGSGIWDSLDYWLDQHSLRRGDQPDFYYLMLLPAYEFLALAFAGPALLYFSLRGGLRSLLLTALAAASLLLFFGADSFWPTLPDGLSPTLKDIRFVGDVLADIPAVGEGVAGIQMGDATLLTLPVAAIALYFAVRGTMFERFLVFWTAATIVAYSWAGEKMPWLSVHTTIPIVILAAYTLGKLFSGLPRDLGPRLLPYLPRLVGAAASAALAVALAAFAPDEGTAGVLRLAGIALALAAIAALLLVRPHRQRLVAVAAAAVFGALALFSLRIAVLATYDHGDVPRELLVYTQTSPQVPDIMERIDRTASTSGLGRDLPVQVDGTYTWPWAWYLRDYTRVSYPSLSEEFEPDPGAVVLVAAENDGHMQRYADRYEPPTRYYLRWWFPEVYRGIGNKENLADAIGDFAADLGRADTWRRWWRYFRDRDVTPQGVEALVYFPLEYQQPALAGLPGAEAPSADLEGRLVIGEPGAEPGQFRDPGGIALDRQGNVYVADVGNARIQKFDPSGRLLATVGEPGAEPGQFNQPADLALDAQGNLYVVDTWNHRVQKFDPDLNFVTAWGQPTTDLINPGPDQMWGPRAIEVDADGNVWVVDTGTHRVRKFGADGTPLAAFGSRGRDPGQFREPVGVAIGPDGTIFIADAGNARIQKFDADFNFLASYPIDQWSDLDPRNKPYLAALPDGRLLASDGPHGRILLIDQDGRVFASLDTVLGAPLYFPLGLAFDADGDFVYVSDTLASHLRRFPFTDFALR